MALRRSFWSENIPGQLSLANVLSALICKLCREAEGGENGASFRIVIEY